MRYDDAPTVTAEVVIDAPVERVWELVTDIDLPARFSTEFLGARLAGRRRRASAPASSVAISTRRWASGRPPRSSAATSRCAVVRLGGHRPRQPVVDAGGSSSSRSRRRRPAPARHSDGPGAVGADHRHHRDARQGGADRRPPPRGVRDQHAGHRSTASSSSPRSDAMTLRVGVGAMPVHAPTASSSSARPSGSASTRCGCRSSGRATRSPRSATSPRRPRRPARHRASSSSAPARRRCSRCRRMSLQALSGGRFVLGVGTSGPQVMEGWHGVRFDRPVRRTRETIEIIRIDHRRRTARIPRRALPAAAARRRRPRASVRRCRRCTSRSTSPSLGPANLRLTGELADGWIGNSFFPETADVFLDPIRDGAAAAGRDARRPRPDGGRRRRVHRRRRGGRPPPRRGLRVHLRCDGIGDDELLQRRVRTTGLRRRRARGAATVAGRRQGRRPPARPDRDRTRHQPRRHR